MVAGLFALLQWLLNRRAQKADKSERRSEQLCAARSEELTALKRMVEVLCLANRTLLYDRIKHIGKSYIQRGYVTVEELEDLTAMHRVYHDPNKLNGNGFLDQIMADVKRLPKRAQ